ncbi:NUDIX hydrolase [Pseudomonas citronellolis]|uniref:NUDIX hydrolase n=1 Tax=Pseudomonas citronellolis TaxID=53408 RepID=UPI0023E4632C|nr:NUDIX hydrolase [Pseudomonas citronellolis]MDF3934163.1 NUDIX hydrolase [Pseudomonas citronellolis]
MHDDSAFTGAKLALFHADHLVVYLRDAKPGIPFPACWDFPGGGREGTESPVECALRELHEEFSIRLDGARIEWQRRYRATHGPAPWAWFMVARLDAAEFAAIRFGDEGQYWRLMKVEEYLGLDAGEAVPYLQERLRNYLEDNGTPANGG